MFLKNNPLHLMEIKNLHTDQGSKVTTVPGISSYVPVRGDFTLFAYTNWKRSRPIQKSRRTRVDLLEVCAKHTESTILFACKYSQSTCSPHYGHANSVVALFW